MQWQWRDFHQLSLEQLYDLLKIRQDVFILEQQCFYSDLDGLDIHCKHLLGYQGDSLVAYLRLIPAEQHRSGLLTLGRILNVSDIRGQGVGQLMMKEAMVYLAEHYPNQAIFMSAQEYLESFYQTFGFRTISAPYDDDGIMHVDMRYDPD